ncbi:manganese catalase family protein [Alkaliphilus metalliredigens]|nr:manganese catalase family protein [Alkaliphilus metalliredigens]
MDRDLYLKSYRPVTDLHEDMAAEQKARSVYEHLINLTDAPGLKDTLRFLRERE